MKKSKKRYYFILIIFLSFYVMSAQVASAASVFFVVPSSVNASDNLDVIINVDTGGISINSVEFIVTYNENLLSFSGYSDDNALMKLWIDPPHETKDAKGKIYLSGIIPGGVSGLYDANKKNNQNELSPLPLVHLIFIAKTEGNASFSFLDSKILQNDGMGTLLPHQKLEAETIIKNNPNTKISNAVEENKLKENTTKESPKTENTFFDSMFLWVISFLLISGFVAYKLLKYKHEV